MVYGRQEVPQYSVCSGRTRKARGVIQPRSEGLRIGGLMVLAQISVQKPEDSRASKGRSVWMSGLKQRDWISPSSSFFVPSGCSVEWVRPIFFVQLAYSNAGLF